MKMKHLMLLFSGLLCWFWAGAQATGRIKRVLFLGNSYTAVNNLPDLVSKFAASTGDSVFTALSTPGGFTLQGHSNLQASLNLIQQPGWDFVVLQEQSQLPAFPQSQVDVDMFPFAKKLDSLIHLSNPCAKVVFFRTWGRQNGDQANCPNWPPVCTYSGMDSLLALRYRQMADSNQALLCPVGEVWKKVRFTYPQVTLYQSDGSHPEIAGSYLAAVSFYTIFFQKNPELGRFKSTLDSATASILRTTVRQVIFDSLQQWNIGRWRPQSLFSSSIQGLQVQFNNQSVYSQKAFWSFGDGQTDTALSPIHNYLAPGTFEVKLISSHCLDKDSATQTIHLNVSQLLPSDREHDLFVLEGGVYRWIWETPPTDVLVTSLSGQQVKGFEGNKLASKPGTVLFVNWRRQGRQYFKKLTF